MVTNMEVLEETRSICPECFKNDEINQIEAQVVKEDGKVWIKKECPKHGKFKSIVFEDPELYEKWNQYDVEGEGPEEVDPLPFSDQEFYSDHKSQSVLTNLFVTNRCNLRCSYCFANAGAEGYVYNPELDEIRDLMQQAREEDPVPSKAIQITGGEPTVREDLIDIIKMADEEGFTHIQLNSNGIKLAESVEYCKKLREAGVNTVYMSFDGISKETDPWVEEHKKAVENIREAGLGVILVPVVIDGHNLDELADIIKYAKDNIDTVRGVNFQPVAFTGRITNLTEEQRKDERVDYAKMINQIEHDLDGKIKEDDWYPVPFVYPVSKLIESLKDERQVEFTANPSCGGATYVFVEDGEIIPVTRFIDVEGFMNLLDDLSEKEGVLKKAKVASSFLKNAPQFIDKEKAPEGINITNLIVNMITRGSYDAIGEFNLKSLFIGSMWFQDAWNLDLNRLQRCVIHYSTPEGMVPFCTYNGLNVGPKIREKHSISFDEWKEKKGKTMEDDLWENGPISDKQA